MCELNQLHKIQAKPYELPPQHEGQIYLTARSIFLNENLSSHCYRYPTVAWNHGSYTSNLRLTSQVLNSWRNKKILDIGGGASVFPEEAKSLLSADVVALDLFKNTIFGVLAKKLNVLDLIKRDMLPGSAKEASTNPTAVKNEAIVQHLYITNLRWIHFKHGKNLGELTKHFEKVFVDRRKIAAQFYKDPNQHKQGDATQRNHFRENQFDVVISVWVLNYLNNEQKRKVLENAIYWCKPGGQLRINPGTDKASGSQKGTLDESGFRRLFKKEAKAEKKVFLFFNKGWVVEWGGKRVKANLTSGQGVLILDVEKA